jgi:hypothetical protein
MQAIEAVAQLTDYSGHVQGTLVLTGKVGEKTEKVHIPISAYVRDIAELQRAQAVPAPITPQTTARRVPGAVSPGAAEQKVREPLTLGGANQTAPPLVSPETGERKVSTRGGAKVRTESQ